MYIINKLFKKKVVSDLLKNKDFSPEKESGINGRTMMEVLGVLAVTGVLSIGGVTGYNYAMNKYRANETIHEIAMHATIVPLLMSVQTENARKYAPIVCLIWAIVTLTHAVVIHP
ncbi:MAG: hypothetical protein ACI4QM_01980 [Alphaproteobacteria bacterium]